jgi:hypothetical protein
MRIIDIKDLELKKLAISRIDNTHYDYVNFLETGKLIHAFNWDSTEEGGAFWFDVDKGKITTIPKKYDTIKDSVVEEVVDNFRTRSLVGIEKYGTTMDRTDLTKEDWINHAIEEAMDFILYLTKLKREL